MMNHISGLLREGLVKDFFPVCLFVCLFVFPFLFAHS